MKRRICFVLAFIITVSLLNVFTFAAVDGTCGDGVYWKYDSSKATLTISGSGKIETEESQIEWGSNAPWQDYIESIKTVVIKNGITEVGNAAFKNCTSLEKIDLPDSLTQIGWRAFYNCKSLRSVSIPAKVTYIRTDAFVGCVNISRVDITDLSKWCAICFEDVYSNPLSYGADLYIDGKLAVDIKINGAGKTASDDTIIWNNAFYNCKSIKSVTVSGKIDIIGTRAFANCKNLTSVTILDGVEKIYMHAFYNCINLSDVEIADSVTAIIKSAFENSHSLTKIHLPSGIDKIESKTFANSALKVIYIPKGVTEISNDAFENTDIKYVYYENSEQEGFSVFSKAVCTYGATKLPDHQFDNNTDYICNLCGRINVDTSKVFSDIKKDGWYKQFTDYSYAHEIFTGTSEKTFSPNDNITRAQFVQVLANLEGVDTTDKNVDTQFSDVPQGKWFTPAVKWASENNIVNGMGDGTFRPSTNVTREQMCVMLTKFSEFKSIILENTADKITFADDDDISQWARNSVYICQQAGIVNGKGNNKFDPKGTGTRAEASKIFTVFHKVYLS